MTNEQILEELKKLKAHTSTPVTEVQTDVNSEIENLDETIADYNEQIAALEAKIADSSNYQYNYNNEERDFTIELLQESFENQLEVMDREDAEYKNLQDLATSIFTDYNMEIQGLNVEIEAIERRIRKNDVAVRKNIGIRLTEQELADLQTELENKKKRLAVCEEMKAKYVEDLRNYGELITANNHKREVVVGKQNSLNRIIENKKNNPKTIDNFKLQSDKDELARLKAGVLALQSRKDYISYNPDQEIDKLIAMVSAGKGTETLADEQTAENTNDKAETLINAYNQDFEEKENEELKVEEPVVDNNEPIAENEEEKDTTLVAPIPVPTPEMEDISSHSEGNNEEEEKSEEEFSDMYTLPSELDEEREAAIEEAKEELKKKKKDNFFKKHWKKFVATGLGVVLIAALAKGCHKTTDLSKAKDDTPKKESYSQTDEGIVEENQNSIDSNYDFSTPSVKPSKTVDSTPSTPETPTINPSTPEQPSVDPVTPDTPVTPEVPDTPDVPDTPTKEKEKIELRAGEKIADLNDIINGRISDDTVISHGDEVGKTTTSGAELKDYTEDGNAVVERDKPDENIKTDKTLEQIKEELAKYMEANADDLDFTDAGNQWLDDITSGKKR